MRATINRQIFTTTVFDSGSLVMLTSLVHQFSAPGIYRAEVRRAGQAVAAYAFEASEKTGVPQLDVDLASLHHEAQRRSDCACSEHRQAGMPVVSTAGYVVFFVSHGDGGYSVGVGGEGLPRRPVFDSERLGEGDLFALSLLEPVRYVMANRLGEARGRIDVSFSREIAKALKTLETQYVETWTDRFEPAALRVASTQGIVFRVRDAARIVVEREGRPERERPRPAPRRITRLGPPARG
jgi:hypothetical protein